MSAWRSPGSRGIRTDVVTFYDAGTGEQVTDAMGEVVGGVLGAVPSLFSSIGSFLAALFVGVFLLFLIWCLARWGDVSWANLSEPSGSRSWIRGGVAYAAYNLGVIPAVLFAIRHAESRRDTLVSGALAGPIAMIPGVLFYLAMAGQYPEILDRPVPANMMLDLLGSRGFQIAFQVVLFGTLIETGTGLIHAVNERIQSVYKDKARPMPPMLPWMPSCRLNSSPRLSPALRSLRSWANLSRMEA